MPYINSVERFGEERGVQKGIQIGEKRSEKKWRREEASTILSRLLRHRFGEVPSWAQDKMDKADLLTLEEWSLRFVDAQSLEKVFTDHG